MPWFPHDVSGWLSEVEGRALARLGAGKTVLEIGSFCGRSTVCLAQGAKAVFCVDPFDGRATPEPGSTYLQFEEAVNRYGVVDRVTVCPGLSADIVPTLPGPFDLVFIDAAHDYESVRGDIMASWPKLAADGLFAFHDYRLYPGENGGWEPGVTKAVNQLLAAGGVLLNRFEAVGVVRPPPLPEG